MTIKRLTSITLVALATSLCQPAIAADEWVFEATPYIWAAGLDGTLGVNGTEADVDVSFNDLSKYIDSAFMGSFTARKDRWTYGFDGIYTKLSDDISSSFTGPAGRVDIDGELKITTKMYIYQGTILQCV